MNQVVSLGAADSPTEATENIYSVCKIKETHLYEIGGQRPKYPFTDACFSWKQLGFLCVNKSEFGSR